MEKATYRDNLEMLKGMFPDRAVVPLNEAAKALGISAYSARQDEDFPVTKIGGRYMVSIANLARYLAV